MPTAIAADGHAVRTQGQVAVLSVCGPVSRAHAAPNTSSPMSEKNEQYQFFMSVLSQNRRVYAISSKVRAIVIQLKAQAVSGASRTGASFSAGLCRLANLTRVGLPV
jgi:hypothetical protein